MNDLKIMPKPDYVSWEDVSELLQKANKVNEKKGFSMSDLNLPPDSLKQQIEGEGFCVVALVDDKLVGVSALWQSLNGNVEIWVLRNIAL